MDKFKEFYNEKNGKAILFFGFYLVFFIFLGIYMRSMDNKEVIPEEIPQEEKITTYNISNLINNDYSYEIEIHDNEEIIKFNGTKLNIDYANYENKYFLDIYNLNQLLKKSKFISSEDYVLSYEIMNLDIDDLLVTETMEGVNKILVYVDKTGGIEKVFLDLSSYLQKDKYTIMINYSQGEKNENSIG